MTDPATLLRLYHATLSEARTQGQMRDRSIDFLEATQGAHASAGRHQGNPLGPSRPRQRNGKSCGLRRRDE